MPVAAKRVGEDDLCTGRNEASVQVHDIPGSIDVPELLGLVSMVIAFKAGRLRGKKNIPLGDGGDRELLLAMRRQGNFVEYVPLALILIGLLELNHVQPVALHTLGAALVVARVSHAFGMKIDTMQS